MSSYRFIFGACVVWVALQPAASGQPHRADIIFHNGTIVTMDPSAPYAEAIAIEGDSIIAVGNQGEINRLGGPDTQRLDLEGKTVIPGFVDPHNHSMVSIFLGRGFVGTTYDEAQQILIENGFTTIAEPHAWGLLIASYMVQSDAIRLRTNFYPAYNTGCGEVWGHWYLTAPWEGLGLDPPTRDPGDFIRVPSVKFYTDGGTCGSPAWTVPGHPELPFEGDLWISAEDLADQIEVVQSAGYQAVIHAVGDVGIDTALDAIEIALAGGPNTLGHRTDHNTFTRPDHRGRYTDLGIVPVIRLYPDTCARLGPPPYLVGRELMFQRVREILDANPGRPVSWYSHMGGLDNPPHSAMVHLWGAVTRDGLAANGSVCEAPEWLASSAITVTEALRMMTMGGAAAVGMEEKVGSLEVGKYADLVILSGNPVTVHPDTIKDLEVLATVIGGSAEYCTEDTSIRDALDCPD